MNLRELLKSDTMSAIKQAARINESDPRIGEIQKKKDQKSKLLSTLEALGDQDDGDRRRIKALRAEVNNLNGKLDKMEEKRKDIKESEFKDYVASTEELEKEIKDAQGAIALHRQQGHMPLVAKYETRLKQAQEKLAKAKKK